MLIWLYFSLWILLRACVSLFLKWFYISPSHIFTVLICGLFFRQGFHWEQWPWLSPLGASPIRMQVPFLGMNYSCKHPPHEDSRAEGSLIFRPAAGERLLLSKRINLTRSYEQLHQWPKPSAFMWLSLLWAQKLQFRDKVSIFH